MASRLPKGGNALKDLGYRLTPQRQMILAALQGKEQHVSAEEIHVEVRDRYPSVNISTVYRTMELLKELGLVTETTLEGRVQYHWAEKGRHHHLACEHCGQVTNLDQSFLSRLAEELQEGYDFQANFAHLTIFGHCASCRSGHVPVLP